MNLPPLLELRDLPGDVKLHILEQLVQEAAPRNLCGRLYERCLLLFGSGNCGADHPIWKQACERLGLRRVADDDSTWRDTFQALCRELDVVRHYPSDVAEGALSTFLHFLRWGGADVDLLDVKSALDWLAINPGGGMGSGSVLLRRALLGLGAIDEWPFNGSYSRTLSDALALGDVASVKAALGTGIHPAGFRVFILVNGLSYGRISNSLERLRLLLRAGASPNAIVHKSTALSLAATRFQDPLETHSEVFRLLLEAGADPNDSAPRGTPLVSLLRPWTFSFLTDEEQKVEFLARLRLLIEAGASVNVVHDGETVLCHIVATLGGTSELATEVVGLLLDAGANPNYGGPNQAPPLIKLVHAWHQFPTDDAVLRNAFFDRVRLLLDAGADPNGTIIHSNRTPLAIAHWFRTLDLGEHRTIRENDLERLEEVLEEYGARV